MSLLHAVVARDNLILSDSHSGVSHLKLLETVLSKLPPTDSRMTFAADSLLIHYAKKNSFVFMVVGDDLAGRRKPFSFLVELERVFWSRFNEEDVAHAGSHGCSSFDAEMGKLLNSFLEREMNDPIKVAQAELGNVKDIMVQNINSVLDRGERISLLMSKTDDLNNNARNFRSRSTALRRKMWWQNIKVLCLIGLASLLALFLIVAWFRS